MLCPAYFLRDTTGAQDSFRFRVFHDLLTGADTAPPFCFLRAHHPLTRNRHAPPFAEYITSYGLHPPNDRRRAESVCTYRPRHCKRSGCGTNEFFTSTLRHRFIPRRFRTRFLYCMAYHRLERRLRRTGLCGGVQAQEPCDTDRTTFQSVGEMWRPLWGRTLPPYRRVRRSVRFSNRRTAAPIYGSVPHLRRTAIVPAANDHTPSGTGMTGANPENPVPETMLRPMNPDFTTVLTASHDANGCAGRIVSRGRNTHAAARRPRRIHGASEEPNHLAPHEDRPSATEASPSNDRMRLSSIFHRIVAYDDTQSLNLEVTPFISGVSSATSCFEFEDKKNGRIGRPSMHVGTHVGPMPFSGAVLSCLSHTTASNAASPSVRRPDGSANACEAVVRHGTDLGTSTLSGSRRMPRSTPPGSVPSSGGRSPNRRGGMARHP